MSDLHLFCDRSCADEHLEQIVTAADSSHLLVLGGDIFDFKWSRHGSRSDSIAAARNWLHDLVIHADDCQFCYLLGNHDCGEDFVSELQSLCDQFPQLDWQAYFFRLGSTVFLHGDVIDCKPSSQAQLEKSRHAWSSESPKGSLLNTAYNAIVACRIHRVVAQCLNTNTKIANSLLPYLEDINQGPASGTSQVVFGHTHWATQFVSGGVQFRNGGAALHGLPFTILNLEIEVDQGFEFNR